MRLIPLLKEQGIHTPAPGARGGAEDILRAVEILNVFFGSSAYGAFLTAIIFVVVDVFS
ncbi:MAG: hypothetical protein R3E55_04005 [Burkholderiaceae bacterium]